MLVSKQELWQANNYKGIKSRGRNKKGLLAATASMITSQKNAALASKSFSASLMGAAMVLPFFVDEGKQMNAMLVSMAIMAIPMLIKGIKGISAAMKGLCISSNCYCWSFYYCWFSNHMGGDEC